MTVILISFEYTTHPDHVTGGSISVCGDAHAGQSFVGDFVRTYRRRS